MVSVGDSACQALRERRCEATGRSGRNVVTGQRPAKVAAAPEAGRGRREPPSRLWRERGLQVLSSDWWLQNVTPYISDFQPIPHFVLHSNSPRKLTQLHCQVPESSIIKDIISKVVSAVLLDTPVRQRHLTGGQR